jgi:hypothetical protein
MEGSHLFRFRGDGLCFNMLLMFHRKTVQECILEQFAGPPDTGIFSPSVQNTLYRAERMILDKVEQVSIGQSPELTGVFVGARELPDPQLYCNKFDFCTQLLPVSVL